MFPSKLANGKEVIAKLGLCKLMSWSRPGSIELGPQQRPGPAVTLGLLLVQPDHVTLILGSDWLPLQPTELTLGPQTPSY